MVMFSFSSNKIQLKIHHLIFIKMLLATFKLIGGNYYGKY